MLGPVTVESPTSASPLGKRARALLAVLALSAGSEPGPDELVARVWPTPPPDPLGALAGLRAQLGEIPALTTDVARFTDLTGRAEDAAAAGDLEGADATLSQALALWRGEALEDVRDTPYLQSEARRLTELRLGVIEDRLDLGLRQGRARELVDQARTLVDGNPTRERLWGLLMSALYRSGRGEEAIAVYAEARATLADELGIEPSEALQQLEAGILRTDPALGEVAGPAAQPRRRARIPVLASTTYGRDELVGEVSALLSGPDVRLVTLTGIGGSGKSRVATLTATAVQPEYTDVAYLQVTEASAGPQLTVEITLALGCAATDDLATSLSALAPEQRALVVLDNLEALAEGPEIVRRLLDASAQVTVLVTSRLPLRVPGEHELPVPPLEVPGVAADVDAIAEAASVRLFVDRAMSAEPTFRLAGQEHDVAEVCAMLDGLPLAIELAAVRVKLRSLDRIIDGLRTSLDLLATGSESVPERQRAMTTAIRWSYDRLTPDAQLVGDRLALFERGFTIEAVEAVCPDVPDVIEALASIVDARLVRQMESRADVRFVVLGTVRAFARERLLARPDLMRSRELLAVYLTPSCRGLPGPPVRRRRRPRAGAVRRRRRRHRRRRRLGSRSPDAGRSLSSCMLAGVDCWVAAGRQNQALGLVVLVLDHVPQQGPEAARLLAAASMLSHQLSDHDEALTFARAALALSERLGDRISASTARTFLAAELMFRGELADGLALAARAAAEAEALDLYPLSAQALGLLAMARAYSGDFEGERRAHEAKLAVVRANGDLARTADVLNSLAEIALDDGDGRHGPRVRRRSARRRRPAPADGRARREHHAGAGGPRAGRPRRGRTPAGRGAGPERPPRAERSRSPSACESAAAWPQPAARPTRRSACSLPRRACRRRPAGATCRRTTTSPLR